MSEQDPISRLAKDIAEDLYGDHDFVARIESILRAARVRIDPPGELRVGREVQE